MKCDPGIANSVLVRAALILFFALADAEVMTSVVRSRRLIVSYNMRLLLLCLPSLMSSCKDRRFTHSCSYGMRGVHFAAAAADANVM